MGAQPALSTGLVQVGTGQRHLAPSGPTIWAAFARGGVGVVVGVVGDADVCLHSIEAGTELRLISYETTLRPNFSQAHKMMLLLLSLKY